MNTTYEEAPEKRMGRHSKWSELGMTPKEFYALYEKLGTRKALAKHLGIGERTVTGIFKKLEIKPLGTRRPPKSAIPKWIEAHPGQKLPMNAEKIAEITGLSVEGVISHYWRRKLRAVRWLEKRPRLTEVNDVLIDKKGVRVPSRAIASYKYFVDKWTLDVIVLGELKTGNAFRLHYTWRQMEHILKAIESKKKED